MVIVEYFVGINIRKPPSHRWPGLRTATCQPLRKKVLAELLGLSCSTVTRSCCRRSISQRSESEESGQTLSEHIGSKLLVHLSALGCTWSPLVTSVLRLLWQLSKSLQWEWPKSRHIRLPRWLLWTSTACHLRRQEVLRGSQCFATPFPYLPIKTFLRKPETLA